MTNWTDIHKDFAKEYWKGKTYQQLWEKEGLTHQDAQEWIPIGFEPDDYWKVKNWKNHNFTYQEVKSWRDIGLTKKDHKFAAYLKGKGYEPTPNLNLKQLKEEFDDWLEKEKSTQEYLDKNYPKEKRNTIIHLNLSKENLQEELDLSDFVNLGNLFCSGNKLTKLNLTNCKKLKIIYCYDNNLNQDLFFVKDLVELEELRIDNNPIYGSLEILKNLSKLRYLNISNTDIDSGLEYLPESVKDFYCYTENKFLRTKKVRKIYETLKPHENSFKKWREVYIANNPLLIVQNQLSKKEKQIQELQEKLDNNLTNQIEIEKLQVEKSNLEKELKGLQAKYNELLNQEYSKSLEAKKKELEKFKKSCKFSEDQLFVVEDLLEAEGNLSSCDIFSNRDHYKEIKEKNSTRLKSRGFKQKDINKLCQLQREITQLELDLDNLKPKAKLAIEGSKTTKLLLDYPVFSKELATRLNNFFEAKQNFLNARQQTIKELQECCNKLETFINGKYAVFLEVGNATSSVGGFIPTNLGIPQAIGEAVKAISNLSKIKITQKSSKEFQLLLGNEDDEFAQLDSYYNSLVNLMKNNEEVSLVIIGKLNLGNRLESKEVKLFNNKHKVFDVVIKDGIWEGRPLNVERMEKVIVSLSENLELLKSELEQETKQFSEISSQLGQEQMAQTVQLATSK